MNGFSRRDFIGKLSAVATLPTLMPGTLLLSSSQETFAADVSYDLVIAGGRVVDPLQKIAASRDVAITNGKIANIASNIPRDQARRVIDATGKLVTPGLIDMHMHAYALGIPDTLSIDPDVVAIPRGVTTVTDAGSAGANTFAGFRKYVIERATTRVYALLNISTIGLVVANELYLDPAMIDVKAAVKTVEDNRDVIIGFKVRIRGRDDEVTHDVDVVKKAREASDTTGVPIMMHWTNEPRLLAILKKGDILVHPFNPPRSGPNCLGSDGKVLPQILELKERGIYTDFAHGSHLLWETAEKAAQQGWFPDTISTDMTGRYFGPNATVKDLVTTISKFMYLGLPVEQAIEKVTANPMRVLNFPEKLGSLEPGSTADVSILNVEEGNFELLDSMSQKRTGRQRIVPIMAIKGGKVYPASA